MMIFVARVERPLIDKKKKYKKYCVVRGRFDPWTDLKDYNMYVASGVFWDYLYRSPFFGLRSCTMLMAIKIKPNGGRSLSGYIIVAFINREITN